MFPQHSSSNKLNMADQDFLNTDRLKFILFVRQVKRTIMIQITHYENAIIARFHSNISNHMGHSADPGILQWFVLARVHFPTSLLPPGLSHAISLFLSIQPTLLPYLSNFSLTVLLCHNSHPFLSFISFLQYFSLCPSLLLLSSPPLFALRLIRRWQTTAYCLLLPRLISAEKNKAWIGQLFNILAIWAYLYCRMICGSHNNF